MVASYSYIKHEVVNPNLEQQKKNYMKNVFFVSEILAYAGTLLFTSKYFHFLPTLIMDKSKSKA